MRATLTADTFNVARRDTLFRDVFDTRDVTNYDVFPDGKRLLMIQSTTSHPHGAIILNFPELLRRRAVAP